MGGRAARRCGAVLGGLVAVTLAVPTLGSQAGAATTVDTTPAWPNSGFVCCFGRPDSSTVGQVVTARSPDTVLDTFTFFLRQAGGGPIGPLVLRGAVFRWDGPKASGPALWESAPVVREFNDITDSPVVFVPGGVELTPGQRYVLVASISKDYERNVFLYWTGVGFTGGNPYPGGGFVFLNDSGDESLWTSRAWDTSIGGGVEDLAFQASSHAPTPATRTDCTGGGWRRLCDDRSRPFASQGRCIAFVHTRAPAPVITSVDAVGTGIGTVTGDDLYRITGGGTLSGTGLSASYRYDYTSPEPGTEPAGTTTVTTPSGTLTFATNGHSYDLRATPGASAEFGLTHTLVRGTGAYEWATGVLSSAGSVTVTGVSGSSLTIADRSPLTGALTLRGG